MHGFSYEELLRLDAMHSTDFGESIRHTGAYDAASEYVESNATDETDWKIAGGNSRLVDALADAIRKKSGSIHEGVEVVTVRQRRGKVTVELANGGKTTATADACICAIPACRLRAIKWSPKLPPAQAAAADRLHYARIMKSAVLYPERFWPKPPADGFSVLTNRDSDFCFDSTHLQPGVQGILCSYAIGDKADDLAAEPDENDVMEWITDDMRGATATKKRVKPIAIKTQAWQREPTIGGAYALYRPGQWFELQPILRKSHGRVHFAGEHLADTNQGFMEGAVETGRAAADAL
jgi:monoamine oxidase